ncbi:MAG: hypothetical protein AAB214_00715 [Fibrobacterota bacterium]
MAISLLAASCASRSALAAPPTRSAEICFEILHLRDFQEAARKSALDSSNREQILSISETRIQRLAKMDSMETPDESCHGYRGKMRIYDHPEPERLELGARIVGEILVRIVLPAILK